MKEEGSPGGAKSRIRLLILLSMLAACVILAFYGTVVLHIAIVYTHVFYIPIILAGVWYHKKAVYVALGLGLVHILVTIFSPLPLSASEFVRAAIFIAVAYVISFVSEKAEEEKRLRISVEKLARIIDSSTIPTFVLNRAHKIIHWNAALELLTGVKREEVIGTDKQWQPFYPEKRPVTADFLVDEKPEREISEKYGDKCAKSPLIAGAYEALDFFPSLGESGKWLLFTAAPLRETDGALIGALETVQDITELKRAQERKRQAAAAAAEAEAADAVIKAIPDAVVVLDLNGVIVNINPAETKLFGYKPEERIGKGFDELTESLKAEDIERFMKLLGELIETGHVEPIETVIRAKDGREVPTSVATSLIKDADGNPKNIVAVVRDITELKRAQEKERDAAVAVAAAVAAAAGKARIEELEKFAKLTTGREQRIIELKRQVKELEEKLKAK